MRLHAFLIVAKHHKITPPVLGTPDGVTDWYGQGVQIAKPVPV
jgi:hypothetical protein